MVDTGDLKSPASNGVQVRLLFRANDKAPANAAKAALAGALSFARKATQ
jgi:hypothetical protein